MPVVRGHPFAFFDDIGEAESVGGGGFENVPRLSRWTNWASWLGEPLGMPHETGPKTGKSVNELENLSQCAAPRD